MFLHSDIKDLWKTKMLCTGFGDHSNITIPDEPDYEEMDKKRAVMKAYFQSMYADRILSIQRVNGVFPIECKGGNIVKFVNPGNFNAPS